MSEEKENLRVNEDLCIGCGACQSFAPEYFDASEGVAKVIKDYDQEDRESIENAIDSCPAQAISLEQ